MDLAALLRELDGLKLPEQEYAITASGAMAARGIREANDLDVIVTPRLWALLAAEHRDDAGKIVLGEHVEVLGPRSPLSVDGERQIERAEVIEGHRYVLLPDVRDAKVALGRPKDRRDVELIDAYLSGRSTELQRRCFVRKCWQHYFSVYCSVQSLRVAGPEEYERPAVQAGSLARASVERRRAR